MDEDKISEIIINSINSIKKIKDKKKFYNKNFDFYSSGYLDSLQLMHFIILIKKRFNINFTPKDKEDKKFRYVTGLSKLIFKKLKN